MKKIFWITISLVSMLAPFAAIAQSAGVTKTAVPFAFYAGKELMPAGTYIARVDDNDRQLTLQSDDGKVGLIMTALPSDTAQELNPSMRFDKVGDIYFLRSLSDSDQEFDFGQTKLEKQLSHERNIAQVGVASNGM